MAGGRENLIPFKPGQSGNPNGRPKKLPELDKLLDAVLGAGNKGKSEAELILRALLKKAKRGDVRAGEILLDRAYGKPKQQIENTNHNYDMIALTAEKVKELEELKKKEF